MKTFAAIAASVVLLGFAVPAGAAEPTHMNSRLTVIDQAVPTDVSARHRRWHRPRRVCTTHWRHGRRVTVCRWRY